MPARKLTRSNAHFQKALKRLPLGVASTFRYWGEDRTIYVDHGKGGRFWDIDGNDYVDYRLGYGPAILGYADDRVDAAARRGMEVGGVFALSTERELIVADRIAKMVPGVDLVRYSNSGTEAVMAALRLARAHTGRDSYLLVEGGYHGLFDAAMWIANVEDWEPNQNRDPEVIAYSKGVPQDLRALAHLVPMNDLQRLEDTFRKHGDTMAAMLIEPIQGNCCGISATPEYVRLARESVHPLRGAADHRRGQDRLPGGARRRPVDPGRGARYLDLRQGDGQRLSHRRHRRARGSDAQLRLRQGGPWRHLYRPFGQHGRDRGMPAHP